MAEERVLQIAVNDEYFQEMLQGVKTAEYRQFGNQYWRRRILDKEYDKLIITSGYPAKTDKKRRIEMPYTGYDVIENFVHKVFGDYPQPVFAIRICPIAEWDADSRALAEGVQNEML